MLPEKPTINYSTLEEIRLRKEQLSEDIEHDSDKIGTLWGQLFVKQENATRGEYLATIVSNSITAIDAFLLIRKLMKNYRGVLNFFGGNSKKKKSKH